jgi:hypothetical protein
MQLLRQPVLRLTVFSLALGMPARPQSAVRPPTIAEQYLLSAADHERSALGLPPLRRDPALVRAATIHARIMLEHNNISHQYQGELELSGRAAAAGARFSVISENVAEGPTALEIHDAWMHSPGHRRNLLDPSVDAVGIAVVAEGDQLFAVEDFERTVQRLTLSEQEAAVAALLPPYGVTVLPVTTDARRTCAADEGFAGSHKPLFIMRYTGTDLSRLPAALETHLRSGRYTEAVVGACAVHDSGAFSTYSIAVLLY